MAFSTVVAPLAASQSGALPGHSVRCSCGAVQTTSLGEREARQMAWAHAEWHKRNGAK